jgi:hypothetical protein
MRLNTFVPAVLAAIVFAATANAKDAEKRSAELQVLDRFVGTWDIELTIKIPGKEIATEKSKETRKWSRGGRFVHFENQDKEEFHMLLTYDAAAKNYPGVIIAGTFRTLITGTWDTDAATMSWTATFPDGAKFTGSHKFKDENHAETKSATRNPAGEIVMERTWKETRRVADDNPLEPMNRRVGTWINKTYENKAEWTPEAQTATGKETIKWVLDKKFIQGDMITQDGAKGHWLMNYDEQAKVYRTWFFGNELQFPRGDAVGRWNAKTERMDWEIDFGNGNRGEMTLKFHNKDKWEWTLTIRDATGKLMIDNGGTQTRKK